MTTHKSNISLRLECENLDDISSFKHQIMQLTKENDHYKQEMHSLQSTVQLDSKIKDELNEAIENLEKSKKDLDDKMDKKINDIKEKNGIEKKELMSRLNEMECELENKTHKIEELQNKLIETKKLLSLVTTEKKSTDSTTQNESIVYTSHQLNEVLDKLLQETMARSNLEETVDSMSKEIFELKEILQSTKIQLEERNKMLESTREELFECRIELDAVKNAPANDMSKGNSLFAEVEDRRKKLLDQMAEMKKSYYEVKRCLNTKDNQIKALKSELAALLNKQKNDVDECVQENGELIEKYKDRILDLENKLSEYKKKYRKLEVQKQPTETFSYFQGLLEIKRKEIDELEAKLENSSIELLKEEEMKNKLSRYVRYWRSKTMSYEAQIQAVKIHLEINNSSIDAKELLKILERDGSVKNNSLIEESSVNLGEKPPPVVDETVFIFDDFNKIPKLKYNNFNPHNESHHNRLTTSNKNISGDFMNLNDELSGMKKSKNNAITSTKHSNQQSYIGNKENEAGISTNSKNLTGDEVKEKKTLRFAEGTVDPEPKKLRPQCAPKYTVLRVFSRPNNNENQ